MITRELCVSLLDYLDGELFWKESGKPAGGVNNRGYHRLRIGEKLYLTHRIVFLMHHGFMPKTIDHVDGNKLNNRIENLREASTVENQQNAKTRIDNKSGIKGVHWYEQTGKWKAELKVNGKTKHIGYFKELGDAGNAIKEYREQQHGNFANHG